MKKLLLILLPLLLLGATSKSQSWSAVGNIQFGYSGPSTVYNGQLFACVNDFSNNGADSIIEWNGASWSGFGNMLNQSWTVVDPADCMTVYNGNLIVGGLINKVNNISVSNVAMWNGTSWSDMGGGINGQVLTFAIYNGNLYAGGNFGIDEWNGSSWSALAGGPNPSTSSVYTLTAYNGNLIVGGYFDTVDGIAAKNIAMWNGTSWSALGAGIHGGILGEVVALTIYNNDLIVGGLFDSAGGHPANNIAMWNGTSWSVLGSGIASPMGRKPIAALTVYNNNLIVAGQFDTAGGQPANNIAEWNGTAWSALGSGTNNFIQNLTVYNSKLYATDGYSGSIYSGFDTAGGIAVGGAIAAWSEKGLSIQEIENNTQTILYPNPSGGTFTFRISNEQLGIRNQIEVYDMLGQQVYSQSNISRRDPFGQNSTFNIDLSSQPSGVYLYRVISEDGNLTGEGKLVIQK